MIVPYPPGGTVDQIGRLVAPGMGRSLGRDVLVENLPGAAGAIGLGKLLAASGNTLAIGTDSDAILVPLVSPDLRYRPEQFRPLGIVMSAPLVLVAGSGLAATDLRAMLAGATPAAPLSIGSYGVGSNSHLCAEDFAQQTGVRFVHVPYKGIAPLLQDLAGGHVSLAFLPLMGGVAEMIGAGKLRALGVAAAQRQPRFPAIPTLDEAGGTRHFAHGTWAAVMLPATAGPELVNGLHAALQDAQRDPLLRKEMEATGATVSAPTSLAAAQAAFDAEVLRYRALVDALRARGVSFRP